MAPASNQFDVLSVLPSFVTIIVAFGVAWLTSRWAQKRSHQEKVWERKSQAYSVIFDALFDLENWFSLHLEDEFQSREVDAETSRERTQLYRTAKDRLYRTIAKEEWLLPEAVVDLFAEMRRVLEGRYESWFEDLDTGFGSVTETKRKLVHIARYDLNQRRPRRDWLGLLRA